VCGEEFTRPYLQPQSRGSPRVCGEEGDRRRRAAVQCVSPPCVRGERRQQREVAGRGGITPASAGRSQVKLSRRARHQDHPRLCGEEDQSLLTTSSPTGSPPRVRGEVSLSLSTYPRPGITPACAGRRLRTRSHGMRVRDHPRVCGEEFGFNSRPHMGQGSPPRVRGGVLEARRTARRAGITPACAGRSVRGVRGVRSSADHPRVCGEELEVDYPERMSAGSPPRVRGGDKWANPCADCRGITPACAGRRVIAPSMLSRCRDHPRVCGEERSLHRPALLAHGSPPRVRGGAVRVLPSGMAKRITPACAGRSNRKKIACIGNLDHPRVCGEEYTATIPPDSVTGSPPRVRGGA